MVDNTTSAGEHKNYRLKQHTFRDAAAINGNATSFFIVCCANFSDEIQNRNH